MAVIEAGTWKSLSLDFSFIRLTVSDIQRQSKLIGVMRKRLTSHLSEAHFRDRHIKKDGILSGKLHAKHIILCPLFGLLHIKIELLNVLGRILL